MNAVYHKNYGLHLYEYLLIIEPDHLVQKQLRAFKQYFICSHRYPNAIVSKGHLTLLRFIQYDSYEQQIIRELERIAMQTAPFDVELHGFGSFGHTLYVDVTSPLPIIRHIADYRHILRPLTNSTKGHSIRFVTKPHITIARKLTPPQHDAIWPIWKRTRYNSGFRARNMTLLKRRVGTYKYSTAHKFDFLGLSPVFTQGKLFA